MHIGLRRKSNLDDQTVVWGRAGQALLGVGGAVPVSLTYAWLDDSESDSEDDGDTPQPVVALAPVFSSSWLEWWRDLPQFPCLSA